MKLDFGFFTFQITTLMVGVLFFLVYTGWMANKARQSIQQIGQQSQIVVPSEALTVVFATVVIIHIIAGLLTYLVYLNIEQKYQNRPL